MPKLSKVGILLNILNFFIVETVQGLDAIAPGEFCGIVRTFAGRTVTLRNGVPLSLEEFGRVDMGKMRKAVIEPRKTCGIHLCGRSSWGESPANYGRYADCHLYEERYNTAVNSIYNERFNTSSLSCGCKENNDEICPSHDCHGLSLTLNWKPNQCGILFEERRCRSCYLRPVWLSNDTSFWKDHNHEFQSLIVRKGCFVERFASDNGEPTIFEEETTWDWDSERFEISYKSDPEVFRCQCGVRLETYTPAPVIFAPPSTTTPSTTPPSTSMFGSETVSDKTAPNGTRLTAPLFSPPNSSNATVIIGVVIGGTLIVIIAAVSVTIFLRRSRMSSSVPAVANKIGIEEVSVEIQTRDLQYESPNGNGYAQLRAEFNAEFRTEFKERSKFKFESNGGSCGHGNFGVVYRGKLQHDSDGLFSEDVAVKVVEWRDEKKKNSFFREMRAFQKIKEGHENIVKFWAASYDIEGLYLLTEFCEGGSLKEELTRMRGVVYNRASRTEGWMNYVAFDSDKESDAKLTPEELVKLLGWCEQIAGGMEYLHSKVIIHSDLAPRNVLLRAGTIKICDFGLSKDFSAQSLIDGLPFHSFAPEHNTGEQRDLQNMILSPHVDIWAFGCTVYQIWTLGGYLYPTVAAQSMVEAVKAVSDHLTRGYRHPPPQLAPHYLHSKLLECWEEEPQRRPQFAHLREFFHGKRIEEESKLQNNLGLH